MENPLEKWRGSRSLYTAGALLGMAWTDYATLEGCPERSNINSDQIIKISQVTNIPLEVLVDYLTETKTKEATKC